MAHAVFRNLYIAANNNARCLNTWAKGGALGAIPCCEHPNLRFTFWTDDTIRHDPQDRCMSAQRGGAHGAPLVVAACNRQDDQEWTVAWSSGNWPSKVDGTWRFRIVHRTSGRCLEDNGGRTRTVNCVGSSDANTWPAAQTWRASKAPPKPLNEFRTFGNAQLVNAASGQCADESSGKMTNGGKVIMWTCNGSGASRDRQLWSHNSVGQINARNGLSLDVENPDVRRGIPIIIWGCNNTGAGMERQHWRQLPDGRLQHIQSGLYLDATNNARQSGQLVLSTCSTTPTQKWQPRGASS
ncbi:MAG: ricin-type beta-trefoil lectin domain protein [Rhodospirillaceae bacterium]